MHDRLHNAGFQVTMVPMANLTQDRFSEWLQEVYDVWED